MEEIVPWLGLFGLWGFAGLMGLKSPVEKIQPGGGIRMMALLGFLGIAGFWIPGGGAAGAFGALGLWGHQDTNVARYALPGWLGVVGVICIGFWFLR